jgi:phage-related minor tail protein
MTRKRHLLAHVTLLALLLGVGSARAETISFADAVSTLAQACGADIKKHCKGINLANNGIGNCLRENQSKVSPTCTSTLAEVTASIKQRLAAQAAVVQICRGDAARLCKGVKGGEAHLLGCLLKASDVVGDTCDQAITDAGWR